MEKFGKKMIVAGLLLVLIGIACVLAPRVSSMAIGVVAGVLLVLAGLVRIAFTFLTMAWGSVLFRVLSAGLAIVAGAYMIAKPDAGAEALAVVAVFYFILDGITEVLFAIVLPPAGGRGWLIFGGVASIALGALIWAKWSVSADVTVGLIIGAKLILDGLTLLFLGFAVQSVTRALAGSDRFEGRV